MASEIRSRFRVIRQNQDGVLVNFRRRIVLDVAVDKVFGMCRVIWIAQYSILPDASFE